MKETILIVDGNSLLFRAFHALPLLTAGEYYTNGVQGFFSMLFKVIREKQPLYCAVCFDEHAPTFRHQAYSEYKAGRKETPQELLSQFPMTRELLQAMKIGVYSLAGYEADDLLGSIAARCERDGLAPLLLTGDRDALQLVNETTSLLYTKKGISETVLFTPAEVLAEYGITPAQVPDWKGLSGDASDHIIGVPGIGDKTAVKLLQTYGTVEETLVHADEIKGKLGERLRDGKESATFSKWLATITREAPVDFSLADCRLNGLAGGIPLLEKYRLNQLKARLSELLATEEKNPAQETEQAFGDWQDIPDPDGLNRLLESKDGVFALHTGSDFTLAFEDGTRFRMPIGGLTLLDPGFSEEELLDAAMPYMGRAVVHDGKSLLHRMEKQPEAFRWDTMLAAYCLNPQENGYSLGRFTDGTEDASALLRLYHAQRERIRSAGMEKLLTEVEQPLSFVLYDMEKVGFAIDRPVLKTLEQDCLARIEVLKNEIYAETGVSGFNLNSPQQLGHVLFEVMGLPAGKKSKNGYSTAAGVLDNLAPEYPVVGKILEYRQAAKLAGTYLEPLQRLSGSTGRVHTTFDQTAAATGRISSNEPNLQNIPVRTPQGREIRRAFVAQPGWVLVDGDYSQIELRVMAHMSEDAAMMEAFNLGQDIHTRTAAEVFGVSMEEVTPDMRSGAKAVNFGLVYGISDFGLATNLGISRKEAAEFISRYFARYPGVQKYMQEAVASGKMNGYATTILGRRRALPELTSSNANLRSFGERAAMNTPVQGTAADIIKMAMVQVRQALKDHRMASRLILQVHDELILECPENEAKEAASLLKNIMENVMRLRVPLLVDVHTGRSWYETK